MSVANVVSISGGKDSTALALLAVERETPGLHFVFADTGHEHQQTYDYVSYLDVELQKRCGVGITTVKADFRRNIDVRRANLQGLWEKDGIPQERIDHVLKMLEPTGIPFLDLCMLRGRFPSTRARFCSQELKHIPIQKQAIEPLVDTNEAVISWQGVRADESPSRAALPERDVEFGAWEPDPQGLLIYRPILRWTAAEVFNFHTKHGVYWNPLYEQGMSRVGCMPCIHAGKSELREIAKRFPEEVARVARWERMVSECSKRASSTFFASDKTPGDHAGKNDASIPGIEQVMEWALTARGGRQYDLLHVADAEEEQPLCSSVYGLCE